MDRTLPLATSARPPHCGHDPARRHPPGGLDFEDRFWALLQATGLEVREFEDLDYFSYLPFFALAGASMETHVHRHGDHFHFQGVTVSVADDLVEGFYTVLEQILAQLQPED